MTQPVQPLRVVQLSDFHLFADTQGKLLGLNTQASLETVLERVRVEQPDMDLIIATGDLSQDGSLDSYHRLITLLDGFRVPVYWLEGNHDKPAPMIHALRQQKHRVSPCVAELGAWTLIMLDSTIPGDVPGAIANPDADIETAPAIVPVPPRTPPSMLTSPRMVPLINRDPFEIVVVPP